jgi:hypothetical protein
VKKRDLVPNDIIYLNNRHILPTSLDKKGGFMKSLFILVVLLNLSVSIAQDKVAVVKLLKGDVSVEIGGKAEKLAVDQWVTSGAVVKTKDKSVVKLVFIDKSQVNIGPNSEMKIEKFGGGDAGVLDLVKGKIRSQVSKDYLQQQNKDNSKMFVKTPNAIMGIRGTDFETAVSEPAKPGDQPTTSLVLYEGSIVMGGYDAGTFEAPSTQNFDAALNNAGKEVEAGQFSVVTPNANAPTEPVGLNTTQLNAMEKADYAAPIEAKADDASTSSSGSIVPPGLASDAVVSVPEKVGEALANTESSASSSPEPEKSNGPLPGSVIDLKTGLVLQPSQGATFDPITKTFVSPANQLTAAADGSPVINNGLIKITPGGFLAVSVPIEVKAGDSSRSPSSTEPTKAVVIVAPPPMGQMLNTAQIMNTAAAALPDMPAPGAGPNGGPNGGPQMNAPIVVAAPPPPPPVVDLPVPPMPPAFPPTQAQQESATATLLNINITANP